MFLWSQRLEPSADRSGAHWGFTSRRGGVSAAPWDGLNLGGHVGDEPVAVEANRVRVAEAVAVPRDHLLFMNQVHGDRVVVVDGPWSGAVPDADAVVTTRDDVALAVLVADCTPVLLLDREAGVAGAVHAGRPGMVAGVVGRAVATMRELGARTIEAAVGPSVCGRCYEVPQEMQDDVAAVEPVSRATTSWGTPSLDVAAGVRAQLGRDGVEVVDLSRCTRESPDLFSYRRDGPGSGRQAGIIRIAS